MGIMAAKVAIVGLIIFTAHFFVLVFRKTRIPDVLLLMIGGLIVGPVLNLIKPEDFGIVGPVMTTIALIVILFESGVNLSLKTLFSAFGQTMIISLITWVFTASAVTLVMNYFTPVGWSMAIMTGAILGGTSSAVVIPLIEGLKMSEKPRTVLFLESALTDVLCIVGAMAMLQAIKGDGVSSEKIAMSVAASFGVAILIGVLAGFVWSLVMGVIRKFPNTIFTTVAYVFIVYGATELLGFSGAIASLAFGVTLASLSGVKLGKGEQVIEIKALNDMDKLFFAETVFLLKTFFFIYLGLSLKFDSITYLFIALGILIPVYIGRFFIIRVAASRKYTKRDASLMTLMIPKGLAAAVLATLPIQFDLPNAEWVPGTVYMAVLVSIGLTAVLVLLEEKTSLKKLYFAAFKTFAEDTEEQLASSVEIETLPSSQNENV